MIVRRFAAPVALLALLAGCGKASREPVPLQAVVLLDVQGMHGGRNLWLDQDGTAIVQIVEPSGRWAVVALHEKRYRAKLLPDEMREAERLVGKHRVLDLNLKLKVGPPDGGHPLIAVQTKGGEWSCSIKREHDEEPDFDPLYTHLLRLAGPSTPAFHEGPFDWDWHPEGFPAPEELSNRVRQP